VSFIGEADGQMIADIIESNEALETINTYKLKVSNLEAITLAISKCNNNRKFDLSLSTIVRKSPSIQYRFSSFSISSSAYILLLSSSLLSSPLLSSHHHAIET